MPLKLQQLSVPCRVVPSARGRNKIVILRPNFACILFTCCTCVLNADAEEQQSQNDIFQDLQPRHPSSHLTSAGPTFSPRRNTDAEGLPTLFSYPSRCSSPRKPHTSKSPLAGVQNYSHPESDYRKLPRLPF